MGIVQSIFFKPQRGYRKYGTMQRLTSTARGTQLGETTRTVKNTLYQLDGVISEQHNSSATITQHPVEYGVNIADHVIKQPQKITINGIVTNSPSIGQMFNKLPGGATFGERALSQLTGSRIREAYAGLVELQNERFPVRLQTGLLVYDNMVLTDISAPNDLQGNLRVTLTFTEIFVVNGETTGVTQATTITPGELDVRSAVQSLVGLGIAGSALLGFKGFKL